MEIAIFALAVLFFIDVSVVSSQLITQTPCANFPTVPMNNFNKNLYAGQWFMHQQYDWYFSANYDCYLRILTPNPDGNQNLTIILVNPGLQPKFQNDGLATYNLTGKGYYTYTSPTSAAYTRIYQILDTDYYNYAIEWSCQKETSGNYSGYLFIMSRSDVVTPETQDKINSIIVQYSLPTTGLRTLNISSCPAELLQVADGPGLLERVLQIVGSLVGSVGGLLGGLLGGILG